MRPGPAPESKYEEEGKPELSVSETERERVRTITMMLNIVHAQNSALFSKSSVLYLTAVNSHRTKSSSSKGTTKYPTKSCSTLTVTSLFAACAVLASAAGAIEAATPQAETLSNIPQILSGECTSTKDCKKARIQHPKSRKAESCTIKCVTTCIQGGEGSPGEGPLNIRREKLVIVISAG